MSICTRFIGRTAMRSNGFGALGNSRHESVVAGHVQKRRAHRSVAAKSTDLNEDK